MSRVAGVVLAAGSGSRMGTPKGELVVDGERLVDRAVRVLREGGCAPVVAVVRTGVIVPGATAVENPDPDRGMRSSLQLALPALDAAADAVAVLLVDVPGVGAEAIAAVVGAWRPGRISVASYAGRRGHPTVMAVADWNRAVGTAGPDEGARAFLRAHPDLVDDVPVEGSVQDLDTPEDVERWTSRG